MSHFFTGHRPYASLVTKPKCQGTESYSKHASEPGIVPFLIGSHTPEVRGIYFFLYTHTLMPNYIAAKTTVLSQIICSEYHMYCVNDSFHCHMGCQRRYAMNTFIHLCLHTRLAQAFCDLLRYVMSQKWYLFVMEALFLQNTNKKWYGASRIAVFHWPWMTFGNAHRCSLFHVWFFVQFCNKLTRLWLTYSVAVDF